LLSPPRTPPVNVAHPKVLVKSRFNVPGELVKKIKTEATAMVKDGSFVGAT